MSELTISSERLTAFAAHLRAEERSPGTIENYLRHIRAFSRLLDGSPVTKETAAAWKEHLLTQDYAPATVNAMLAGAQRPVSLSGLGRVPGKISESPAPAVPGRGPGADTSGVRTSDGDGPFQRTGAAGAAYGDDLRYRHPCLRSAVYHHGGSKTGPDGYLFKRENPNHPPAGKTLPEAAEIRAKTQNRFW